MDIPCISHHICDCLEAQMEILKRDNDRLREWLRRIAEWQVVRDVKVFPIKSMKQMALDALKGKE